MLSVLTLITCACAAHSAFIAHERSNIKPTDIAARREILKLNANYLDFLSGGDKAPPPKAASYSPFKKSPPSKDNSDELQPYFNEAKSAAAEAIGHAFAAKAALEEAEESLRAVRPSDENESAPPAAVETLYEPPAVVSPEPAASIPPQPAAIPPPPPAAYSPPQPAAIPPPQPAAFASPQPAEIAPLQPVEILPAEPAEIVPFQPAETFDTQPVEAISYGTALARPNESMENCPTLVRPASGLHARAPRGRDYMTEIDGPDSLNFKDSFAPYPKGHSTLGKGSFDYNTLSFRK